MVLVKRFCARFWRSVPVHEHSKFGLGNRLVDGGFQGDMPGRI